MKRILSLILVLVMVLGVMPMASAANLAIGVQVQENIVAGNNYTVTLTAPEGYTFDTDSNLTGGWGSAGTAQMSMDGKTVTITYPSNSADSGEYELPAFNATLTATNGDKVAAAAPATKFNVTAAAGHTCDFTENDDNVVTVESTCKTAGTKTITCTVDGCGKTHVITLDKPDHHFVNGKCDNMIDGTACGEEDPGFTNYTVYINKASHTLNVGESVSLTISCDKKTGAEGDAPTISGVVWTAAEAFVSATESGTPATSLAVKALKKGSTTVSAVVTTSDGKSYNVSCALTINDGISVTVPEYINISASEKYPNYSIGASLSGKPTGSTHNYAPTFEYSVSGNSVSVGTDGKITVRGTGVSTVTTTMKFTGTNGAQDTRTGTTKISVYPEVEIAVTMAAGRTGFDFGEYKAIGESSEFKSLAAKIRGGANSGIHNGCHVYFTNYETTDGKLKMAGGTGNLRASTVGMLDEVRFTPTDPKGGSFLTSYKVWDSTQSTSGKGLIYGVGTLTIKYGTGAGIITYKTTNNKAVSFDDLDFKQFWKDSGYTSTPNFVMFDGQPALGDLYTNTNKKTKSLNTDKYYFSATGSKLDLDYVTYDPSDVSVKYEDEIDFVIYGGTNDTDVAYGTVVIEVGQKNPFTDVKTSDYFYDAVMWAVEEEITAGTSATTFSPTQVCTRGQVVTFLWRADGEPAPKTTVNPFSDVKKTDYFYEAVLWAYEKGITTGITATTFGPNQAITRSQAVTFLYRYHNEPTVTGTNSFVDVSSTAYYDDAVTWAVKNGITTGMSATKFAPNDGCTRAQIVTFLYRDAQ